MKKPGGEMRKSGRRKTGRGFTLVELLVVLAIISLLITIVAPHYVGRVNRAEEAVLKEDLVLMRDALDKHYADAGVYPNSLDDLVSKRYLRSIPPDPITQSAQTWVAVPPADAKKGRVFDVRSGAPGNGTNGKPYAQW
jgi:general secretion pathway protein G